MADPTAAQEGSTAVAVCAPADALEALAESIELELDRPILACPGRFEDERATLAASGGEYLVRVVRDSVLDGLIVSVTRRDGRTRQRRTRLPQDLVDARAVAVVAAALLRSLVAEPDSPSPEPSIADVATAERTADRSPSDVADDAVLDRRASPTARATEPPVRTQPSGPTTPTGRGHYGVTASVGLDAKWLDARRTFDAASAAHAITFGGELFAASPEGHGAALEVRLGAEVFDGPEQREVHTFHVDLRYAFLMIDRAHDLSLRLDAGFAIVHGSYEDGDLGSEALGVGAVLAAIGSIHVDALALGWMVAYTAIVDTGAGAPTFGHSFEVALRIGAVFLDALAL